MLLLLVLSCIHQPPVPSPPPKSAQYDVWVVIGSGSKRLDAHYVLEVSPASNNSWSVHTSLSEGTMEDGGSALTYSSAEPRSSDPLPMRMQHTVAATPIEFALNSTGKPSVILGQEGWKERAMGAIDTLQLTGTDRTAALRLLETGSVLRDIQRMFPGYPQQERWERADRVAGLAVVRDETCEVQEQGGVRRWNCLGSLRTVKQPSVLSDGNSSTLIEADKLGLMSVETSYDATIKQVDNSGMPIEAPIAGLRRVQRR